MALLFSVVLISGGVYTILGGGIAYQNYWGGTVFAPIAIVLGVVLFLLVLLRWRQINRQLTDENGKPFVFPGSSAEWRKW